MTLEGWSDIMEKIVNKFGYLGIIYFIVIIFIGNFFLINLLLAVIISKFNEN